MAVADLGPGAGQFTLRLARAVEPDGVVYAIDTNRRTLDELVSAANERGIETLRTVPARRDRLGVPGQLDLLFVSAVYHHLPDQSRYFAGARTHLRSGARVAILESRREGLLARWLAPHASDPRKVQREMEKSGYRLVATHDVVRGSWFAEFQAD